MGELAMGVAARSTPQLGSGAITEDPHIDRHKTLVVDVSSEVPIEFLASGLPHPREFQWVCQDSPHFLGNCIFVDEIAPSLEPITGVPLAKASMATRARVA
jgi:hypothetical protein